MKPSQEAIEVKKEKVNLRFLTEWKVKETERLLHFLQRKDFSLFLEFEDYSNSEGSLHPTNNKKIQSLTKVVIWVNSSVC